jgi:hypothetical protein
MRTTTCAPRFSLALPVRYRVAGETNWQPAKTRNLSTSGVLFRTRQVLASGTVIDLEIDLNEAFQANLARGRGEVVRYLKDESGRQDGWFVAVKYREYRLERKQEPTFPAPLPKRLPFGPVPAHR